jgi:hypothetical protein
MEDVMQFYMFLSVIAVVVYHAFRALRTFEAGKGVLACLLAPWYRLMGVPGPHVLWNMARDVNPGATIPPGHYW